MSDSLGPARSRSLESTKRLLLLSGVFVACAGRAQEPGATLPAPTPADARAPSSPTTASQAAHAPPPQPEPSAAPDSPAPSASVFDPPEAVEPPVAVRPAASGRPPPCALTSAVKVTRRGALYRVTALVRNLTRERLEFDLADRCPDGLHEFSGLPAGYRFSSSCAALGCALPLVTIHLSLPPGEWVEVDSVDIDPDQAGCGTPLPPGRYQLGLSLPTAPRVCGAVLGTIVLKTAKRVKPRETYRCPPQQPCF